MENESNYWRKCSACKKPIAFHATYWVCSVSTCNRKRTGLVFCSVPCWDSHVPMMKHRNAWAEEKRAPSREQWERELREDNQASGGSRDGAHAERAGGTQAGRASAPHAPGHSGPTGVSMASGRVVFRRDQAPGSDAAAPRRIRVAPDRPGNDESPGGSSEDILVVASKLKAYIRAKSGMNTSASVLEELSDRLRDLCDDAIEVARQEGRRTVLDRDFQK